MELNSLFHCEQTTKKSVSYFALDGGATELYIMSKSRVNDILISVRKKNFCSLLRMPGKSKRHHLSRASLGFWSFLFGSFNKDKKLYG